MAQIRLKVPMIKQGANPICWVACAAMIISYKRHRSVSIGQITGGYDPSNSSVPNPATSWAAMQARLQALGFVCEEIVETPGEDFIEKRLRAYGPLLLSHFVQGFPYDGVSGPTCTPAFGPNDAHAVVITGVNTHAKNKVCYMNNPWGAVDVPVPLDVVLESIESVGFGNDSPIAYLRQ